MRGRLIKQRIISVPGDPFAWRTLIFFFERCCGGGGEEVVNRARTAAGDYFAAALGNRRAEVGN